MLGSILSESISQLSSTQILDYGLDAAEYQPSRILTHSGLSRGGSGTVAPHAMIRGELVPLSAERIELFPQFGANIRLSHADVGDHSLEIGTEFRMPSAILFV